MECLDYQTVSPDEDKFSSGLSRVRICRDLLESNDSYEKNKLKERVPKFKLKNNNDKLFFYERNIFVIRFHNNLITLRNLTRWTVSRNLEALERVITYIISVIYCRDSPSRANASSYRLFYYTEEIKKIPHFFLLHSSIDDTIIGEKIEESSEHSMVFSFDNDYNTPVIKGPNLSHIRKPKWMSEINWRPVLESHRPLGLVTR